VERLQAHTSVLHILVNNSGIAWGEPYSSASEHGFSKVLALNVATLFHLTRACTPLLAAGGTAEKPATVVNIGSVAGLRSQPYPTFAYDASKAAVHHLTRKLASFLADKHITVNAIAPGYVPSRMSASLSIYENSVSVEQSIPLGRLGRATDMAGVLLWLVSGAGSWVTGVIVPVDGGYLLPQAKL